MALKCCNSRPAHCSQCQAYLIGSGAVSTVGTAAARETSMWSTGRRAIPLQAVMCARTQRTARCWQKALKPAHNHTVDQHSSLDGSEAVSTADTAAARETSTWSTERRSIPPRPAKCARTQRVVHGKQEATNHAHRHAAEQQDCRQGVQAAKRTVAATGGTEGTPHDPSTAAVGPWAASLKPQAKDACTQTAGAATPIDAEKVQHERQR